MATRSNRAKSSLEKMTDTKETGGEIKTLTDVEPLMGNFVRLRVRVKRPTAPDVPCVYEQHECVAFVCSTPGYDAVNDLHPRLMPIVESRKGVVDGTHPELLGVAHCMPMTAERIKTHQYRMTMLSNDERAALDKDLSAGKVIVERLPKPAISVKDILEWDTKNSVPERFWYTGRPAVVVLPNQMRAFTLEIDYD